MFRARVWCTFLTIDLVKQAQGGEHEAFETLARGAYHRLLAIAYRILRDQSAADDAVQRALIHAWSDLPTLRDPGRFDAWLYRLIVNACRDEQRQAKRWRLNVTVTDINVPRNGSELDAVVERNDLDRIFRKLSVEHRAVLVLHHYVGLSAPEVAAALGIPTGTVYSRLHYGTRELRDLLEKQRARTADMGGNVVTGMDRDREMIWLDYLREGPEQGSLTKLERIFDVTRHAPQRRPWRSPSWWLPNLPTLGTPARLTVYLVLLMLLMLALTIGLVASQSRLPRPFGLASNGALIVEADGGLMLVNADGSDPRPVQGGEGRNAGPKFSPDGTKFVFWSHPEDGTPIWGLYVADADGTDIRKISGDLRVETHPGFAPSWSPDSSRVVFASETDLDGILYNAPSVLYVAEVDGSAPPMQITHGDGQDHSPAWSPDGDWIAYATFSNSENVLAVARADGSDRRVLHRQPVTHGADEASFAETISWTSDSMQVAYVRGADVSNPAEADFAAYVATTDLNGNERTLHEERGGWAHLPFWSPDDRWLAFDTGQAIMHIRIVSRDGTNAREIGSCRESNGMTWSPDGRYLVSTCGKSNTVIPIDAPDSRYPAPLPSGASVDDWQRVAP